MTVGDIDLVVRGGTVVNEAWSGPASVAVDQGRVIALQVPGEPDGFGRARHTIDATGKLVMPGGVDPHCHVTMTIGLYTTLDDHASASLAALAGGTTTIVDFALPSPGQDPLEALDHRLRLAKGSRCDYGIHACVTAPTPRIGWTVQAFADRGVRTVKLFTTYRDLLMASMGTIDGVIAALKSVSGLAYVHAESNVLVESAQLRALEGGHIAAKDHASTRPVASEARAVTEILEVARRNDAPVYFVHQSTPEVVDLVIRARLDGVHAISESCPHYLTLDDSCYGSEHPERWVCCPPLRDRATVEALDRCVEMGFIDTIGSDNCCYSTAQKTERADDVRVMPNGLPGVETRLAVIFDRFVASGRISPERFVALVAANPARMNGMYPRKGTIAPGSDADIVIFDPGEVRVVAAAKMHMKTDYSPYEGRSTTGWPVIVLARGKVVVDNGRVLDPGPVGEFVAAEPIELGLGASH